MAISDTLGGQEAPQERPTASRAEDVVAVLDGETFAQLFPTARPLTATIFEVAEPMEHPIENGAMVTDHIVFKPVEIDLPLIMAGEDYPTVFGQIRQHWKDAKLVLVQTRAATYPNMLITEIPHDETAETMDGITMAFRLREAIIVTPEYGGIPPKKVAGKGKKAAARASTVKKGQQQTTPPPPAQEQRAGSALYRLTRPKGT